MPNLRKLNPGGEDNKHATQPPELLSWDNSKVAFDNKEWAFKNLVRMKSM